MADIDPAERKLLETIFQMEEGYFLDFTNREFAEFFEYYGTHLDPDNLRLSKANCFRKFLKEEPNATVEKVLRGLSKYTSVKEANKNYKDLLLGIADRLRGISFTEKTSNQSKTFSLDYLEESLSGQRMEPRQIVRLMIKLAAFLVKRHQPNTKSTAIVDHHLVCAIREALEQNQKNLDYKIDNKAKEVNQEISQEQILKWIREIR